MEDQIMEILKQISGMGGSGLAASVILLAIGSKYGIITFNGKKKIEEGCPDPKCKDEITNSVTEIKEDVSLIKQDVAFIRGKLSHD